MSGIRVGLNKGFPVTKKENPRVANNKKVAGKRTTFIRELIKEVSGTAPYEKRIMELLKTGRDKRALKFAKKKLGGHIRGKRKREECAAILRKMRK